MAQKRWTVGVISFLTITLTLAGFVAFAAETGSKNDPLLTVGYVSEEFQPAILQKIDELVKQRADEYNLEMTAKVDSLSAQISSSSGSFDTAGLTTDNDFINAVAAAVIEKMPASAAESAAAGGWAKVEIKKDKVFSAEVGTEMMLRLGSATCVATGTPGLIDMTTAQDLANGKQLEKNHHYMSTIAGRGFKVTADVTIFVRGAYTIT